jgi:hypothetical protein
LAGTTGDRWQLITEWAWGCCTEGSHSPPRREKANKLLPFPEKERRRKREKVGHIKWPYHRKKKSMNNADQVQRERQKKHRNSLLKISPNFMASDQPEVCNEI